MTTDRVDPRRQAAVEALSTGLASKRFDELDTGMQEKVTALAGAVLAAVAPISWLRGHRVLEVCPGCGQGDLSTVGIVKLGYEFVVCDCGTPEYPHPHLVEQMWHREHMVRDPAEVGWSVRWKALDDAVSWLARAARKGEAGAHPRQQLTFAGGLRHATRIVEKLRDQTLDDYQDGS